MDLHWVDRLGKEPQGTFKSIEEATNAKFTIVEVPGCQLYNYYDAGLSVTVVDNRVDSIDFYFANHSYRPCHLPLPYGLRSDLTGAQLVSILGEPLDKGGGGINIWLRWNGVQIELNDRSWDSAKDATMKALTIF